MKIREYDSATDIDQLRRCVIQLQDFERQIDSRLPSGESIADDYIAQMTFRCQSCDGQILVAESDGVVAGYVLLLKRMQSDELHESDVEYGLIADLVVDEDFRGDGIGRRLMQAAESTAKTNGVRWLRVAVIAGNDPARKLYAASGFSELYAEFEKDLGEEAV